MEEYTYKVIVDNKVYARDMDLETALTLVRALFDKWYNEPELSITIQRDDSSPSLSVMEDAIEVAEHTLC